VTATEARPPDDVGPVLAAAVDELAAQARGAGQPDLADRLRDAAARWPEASATVVVVGEAGAGRSTVVNALVGRLDPPLLPLGGSLAVVRTGPTEEVRAHSPGQSPRVGSIAAPPAIEVDDTVEVVLPSVAAGDRLVLVDAPAAGREGDPRRRVIDALVAEADGVILVTRADAPLTAPEVDLLRAARRRVGAALVVTTHVDRHRGWRDVIDESRATIRAGNADLEAIQNLPLAAPLAADAIAAAAAGEADADALAEESGLTGLLQAVRAGFADDLERLRVRALAEMGRDVADELLDRAATSASATAADVEAIRRGAEARRESLAAMLVELGDEFTLLREALPVEVGRVAADVTREVNATLSDERDAVLVPDFAAHLLEAARIGLEARIDRRVHDLVRRVLTGDAQEEGGSAEVVRGSSRASDHRRRGRHVSASMRLRLVQALLSSGGGVAMLAVVGGTGASAAEALRVGALGVGMLVGGVRAVENVRDAKRQRTSQAAKAALRTTVEGWRDEYLVSARERLLREQRAQEAAMRDAVRSEIAELESSAAALEAALAGGSGAVTGVADVAELQRLRTRLDDIARRPSA
jgi:hypothetical protein